MHMDEAARLDMLHSYRVLDTPPDPEIDDLTRLAAACLRTPMAAVSFIDGERQWIKSKVGLQHSVIPRSDSFCSYVVSKGDLFTVRDSLTDPRFAGNPLVISDPQIRFYAGAPLLTPQGHVLGTLAVMDRKPRRIAAGHFGMLRVLARQVMGRVELGQKAMFARDNAGRTLSDADLHYIILGARCILWRANVTLEGDQLQWRMCFSSEGAAQRFLPIEKGATEGFEFAWYNSKLLEDRQRMDEVARQAILGGESGYTQEFRCRQRDGIIRWLREDVRIFAIDSSRWDLVGVCTDITEQKETELALRESEERSRTLLASLPQRVLFKDKNSIFVSVNKQLANDLGTTPDEVAGKTDYDFFPKDLADKYREDDRRVMQSREAVFLEEKNVVQGQERIVEVTKAPVIDDSGQILGVLGVFTDITERKRAQAAMEEQARITALRAEVSSALAQSGSLHSVLQHCASALVRHLEVPLARIWTLNEADRMLELRASAGIYTHINGTHSRIALGELKIGRVGKEARAYVTNALQEDPHTDKEWPGKEQMVGFAAYPLQVEERVVGVIAISSRRPLQSAAVAGLENVIDAIAQCIQRKQAEELLEYQALHDSLTGLPNRTVLRDRLNQAIKLASRNQQSVALLLMDLDRFKEINDTFGHHAGDVLLQQLKPRLELALRECDTVARLGGDEFAIVLPDTGSDGAVWIARKVLATIEEPIMLEDCTVNVGASIGIALYPEHGKEVSSLLRRADIAMYHAKQSGLGHSVYDPQKDRYTASRLSLIGDLRRAVQNDEFVLHYQPKVNLVTGNVVGVEALVRWQHPQHGFMPPNDFIPMAEHRGLIQPISLWVLSAALRQVRRWKEMGIEISVAVNLSTKNLQDTFLVATITKLLRKWRVPATSLVIEITESAVMADPDRAIATLTSLRDMGVRISIDDFGTGYSSLAYLKKMPVHQVKIDKSFVRDIADNREDSAIARSVVDLGHNLGMQVVAEGVESQEGYDLLAGMGCDVAQGFHISKPIPAHELTVWLNNRQAWLRLPKAA
jgi:diguanylate cyclase (GGDEF)-like protein/PAS domain S-box-containing protein